MPLTRATALRWASWLPLLLTVLLTALGSAVLVDAQSDVNNKLAQRELARDRGAAWIDLRTALLDAETGQRGYLLTGQPAYLEPYRIGATRLDDAVDHAFSSEIQRGVTPPAWEAALRGLVVSKRDELAETIRLYDSGAREAALDLVETNIGRQDMDRIRAALDTAITLEDDGRRRAESEVKRARDHVARMFLFLLSLMCLLVAWTFVNALRARRTADVQRGLAMSESARERIELLAHELDHRMKNMFAVFSGLIRQTARGRSDDIRDYAEDLDGRLRSMSHAYSVTRRLGEARTMSKDDIIDKVVRGQLLDDHTFEADGPAITIHEEAVTPLALLLHELTTNALKHGAWTLGTDQAGPIASYPGVFVQWRLVANGVFELVWKETNQRADQGGRAPVSDIKGAEGGFGSTLIRNCARQLGGEINRSFSRDGLTLIFRAPANRVLTAPPDH